MDVSFLQNQKEYIGNGSRTVLSSLLKDNKVKRIFLVTGDSSFTESGAAEWIDIATNDYEVFRFVVCARYPSIKEILRGIKEYQKFLPDITVAVGGGKIIDSAKLINILSNQKGAPITYLEQAELTAPGKPLVAIPTTAGSGSEATQFAVLYKDKKKLSLDSPLILPNYAIVDSDLMTSAPWDVVTAAALDTLSQSIEAYWSTQSTEESREYSSEAISMIISKMGSVARNKKNLEEFSHAAHLAGKGINIARTTACHALSYTLTTDYNVPHGIAVGLLLPRVLHFNLSAKDDLITDSRGVEFVRERFEELMILINGMSDISATVQVINDILHQTKAFTFDVDISTKNVESLVGRVNLERLDNNPVKMERSDIYQIYQSL